MVFGLDSVHGAIYVKGATIFPHQINAAATFNEAAAQEMGRRPRKRVNILLKSHQIS
jgi:beta-glucosidase